MSYGFGKGYDDYDFDYDDRKKNYMYQKDDRRGGHYSKNRQDFEYDERLRRQMMEATMQDDNTPYDASKFVEYLQKIQKAIQDKTMLSTLKPCKQIEKEETKQLNEIFQSSLTFLPATINLIANAEQVIQTSEEKNPFQKEGSTLSNLKQEIKNMRQVKSLFNSVDLNDPMEYLALSIIKLEQVPDKLNEFIESILSFESENSIKLPIKSIKELFYVKTDFIQSEFVKNLTSLEYSEGCKESYQSKEKVRKLQDKLEGMFNRAFQEIENKLEAVENTHIINISESLNDLQAIDLSPLVKQPTQTFNLSGAMILSNIQHAASLLSNSMLAYQQATERALDEMYDQVYQRNNSSPAMNKQFEIINTKELKELIFNELLKEIHQQVVGVKESKEDIFQSQLHSQTDFLEDYDMMYQSKFIKGIQYPTNIQNDKTNNNQGNKLIESICKVDWSWSAILQNQQHNKDIILKVLQLREQTFQDLFEQRLSENISQLEIFQRSQLKVELQGEQICLYLMIGNAKQIILNNYLSQTILKFILGKTEERRIDYGNRKLIQISGNKMEAILCVALIIIYSGLNLGDELRCYFTINLFKEMYLACQDRFNSLFEQDDKERKLAFKGIKQQKQINSEILTNCENVLKGTEVEYTRSTTSEKINNFSFKFDNEVLEVFYFSKNNSVKENGIYDGMQNKITVKMDEQGEVSSSYYNQNPQEVKLIIKNPIDAIYFSEVFSDSSNQNERDNIYKMIGLCFLFKQEKEIVINPFSGFFFDELIPFVNSLSNTVLRKNCFFFEENKKKEELRRIKEKEEERIEMERIRKAEEERLKRIKEEEEERIERERIRKEEKIKKQEENKKAEEEQLKFKQEREEFDRERLRFQQEQEDHAKKIQQEDERIKRESADIEAAKLKFKEEKDNFDAEKDNFDAEKESVNEEKRSIEIENQKIEDKKNDLLKLILKEKEAIDIKLAELQSLKKQRDNSANIIEQKQINCDISSRLFQNNNQLPNRSVLSQDQQFLQKQKQQQDLQIKFEELHQEQKIYEQTQNKYNQELVNLQKMQKKYQEGTEEIAQLENSSLKEEQNNPVIESKSSKVVKNPFFGRSNIQEKEERKDQRKDSSDDFEKVYKNETNQNQFNKDENNNKNEIPSKIHSTHSNDQHEEQKQKQQTQQNLHSQQQEKTKHVSSKFDNEHSKPIGSFFNEAPSPDKKIQFEDSNKISNQIPLNHQTNQFQDKKTEPDIADQFSLTKTINKGQNDLFYKGQQTSQGYNMSESNIQNQNNQNQIQSQRPTQVNTDQNETTTKKNESTPTKSSTNYPINQTNNTDVFPPSKSIVNIQGQIDEKQISNKTQSNIEQIHKFTQEHRFSYEQLNEINKAYLPYKNSSLKQLSPDFARKITEQWNGQNEQYFKDLLLLKINIIFEPRFSSQMSEITCQKFFKNENSIIVFTSHQLDSDVVAIINRTIHVSYPKFQFVRKYKEINSLQYQSSEKADLDRINKFNLRYPYIGYSAYSRQTQIKPSYEFIPINDALLECLNLNLPSFIYLAYFSQQQTPNQPKEFTLLLSNRLIQYYFENRKKLQITLLKRYELVDFQGYYIDRQKMDKSYYSNTYNSYLFQPLLQKPILVSFSQKEQDDGKYKIMNCKLRNEGVIYLPELKSYTDLELSVFKAMFKRELDYILSCKPDELLNYLVNLFNNPFWFLPDEPNFYF